MPTVKAYLFEYESEDNVFKGEIVFMAESIREAQDKFLDWLKKQSCYVHMWSLSFSARVVEYEI